MAFSITEDHIQRAFNTLHDSNHAAARAAYEFSEKHLKVILAKAGSASEEKTISGRESAALCSDEYARALSDFQKVAELYYTLRDRREAALAVADGWRTQRSDQRAVGKIA